MSFKHGIAEFCPNQGRLAAIGAIAKIEPDCDKPDDGTRIHRREQTAEIKKIPVQFLEREL